MVRYFIVGKLYPIIIIHRARRFEKTGGSDSLTETVYTKPRRLIEIGPEK